MNGRALVGIIIIGFGALMLLDLVLPFDVWAGLFPVLIVAVGVLILVPSVRFGRGVAGGAVARRTTTTASTRPRSSEESRNAAGRRTSWAATSLRSWVGLW